MPPGRTTLAMNLQIALIFEGFAEALTLATKLGVDTQQLLHLIEATMVRSGVVDYKGPFILQRDFTPNFPLRLMHKDLGLALDLGNQLGVALPATAAAREVYNAVKGAAKEDLDYSAVMKFWKR